MWCLDTSISIPFEPSAALAVVSVQKDSQELDDSLVIALQTAKHLKKVSGRMRESLHSELVRCHQQAPVVSGY